MESPDRDVAQSPPMVIVPSKPTVWQQGRIWLSRVVAVGVIFLAKFKALGFILLKILPFFVSLWFYSIWFGWFFALLFLLLIAVHELGHYVVMKRYGIDASFPMFIPGLGAMIFTKSMVRLSLLQQAWIGYAGPFAGTLGAIVCSMYGWHTSSPVYIAAAYTGFFLNMFNLLPVPPFDGSHIIKIISDKLWVVGLLIFASVAYYSPVFRNPLIILLVLLSVPNILRAWSNRNSSHDIPAPLRMRVAFVILYFLLIGVDAAGMMANHITD